MTSAKQVMMEIDALDKKRQHQQIEVDKHKQYWFTLLHHHCWVVSTTMCSAFLIGWNASHVLRGAKGFKTLGRLFPFIMSISQLRQAFPVRK